MDFTSRKLFILVPYCGLFYESQRKMLQSFIAFSEYFILQISANESLFFVCHWHYYINTNVLNYLQPNHRAHISNEFGVCRIINLQNPTLPKTPKHIYMSVKQLQCPEQIMTTVNGLQNNYYIYSI